MLVAQIQLSFKIFYTTSTISTSSSFNPYNSKSSLLIFKSWQIFHSIRTAKKTDEYFMYFFNFLYRNHWASFVSSSLSSERILKREDDRVIDPLFLESNSLKKASSSSKASSEKLSKTLSISCLISFFEIAFKLFN